MNSIIKQVFPVFQMYQALRNHLMQSLSDEDLAFQPGGDNPKLGWLCRQMGEVEYAYIQSFKDFSMDFTYQNDEQGLETSVDQLAAWFKQLDGELESVLSSLSEQDIQSRDIDRGHDFIVSPRTQLEIYKEALLIFYGKVDVYLKAMGKTRSQQWQEWIS
jgi:hypothetical protein